MISTFTNIAAYKFARLADLKPLRERLLGRCKTLALKGTILLSTEGINLFIAGGAEEIEALLADLRAIPGLEELAPKYSESAEQPFTRMLVRIKKEIIAFGVEGIDPAARTSPKLAARELKQWLDEGRPVTLLDTRNDYEVKLGTFTGAKVLPISHFRQFPEAVQALPGELKQQPIVMFCTGGIRCEKAGPFMEREGFEHVYQLEGGILKYFEEAGAAHYEGECFVFDQRVGVDPALRETESAVCFVCQAPLTATEQSDPRYVPNRSCPHCFKTGEQQMRENIARRHERLQELSNPLPGSTPRDNPRPIKIPAAQDGVTLLSALSAIFPQAPVDSWLALSGEGRILGPGKENLRPVDPQRIVRGGEWYFRLDHDDIEPPVNPALRILFEDEAIVVLAKPAPLPMHPCGRFNRNTLQNLLAELYAPQRVRPAHRLDANTTGLVVCARTQHFARLLQPQFERGEVGKIYLARVNGAPAEDAFTCDAPISTERGVLGTREVAETEGLPARTEFRVLQRFPDGLGALLEARPLTGRTNQIRVHLWQLGHPVQGDPAYLPGGQLGEVQTLAPGDPPLCLHAWKLEFTHPLTKERLSFEARRPEWAE